MHPIKDLLSRATATAIAAALAAVTTCAAALAVSFALYGGLKPVVADAGAAGLTALACALLAALIVSVTPGMLKPEPRRHASRPPGGARAARGGEGGQVAAELGLAALGLVADLSLQRRLKREEKARNERKSRRRIK